MTSKQTTFIEKVSDIQARLKAPKGQYNNFGGYKYRSCEDILEMVKPLLSEHNLILNLKDEIVQIGERYYIKATASLTSDGSNKIESQAFAREALTKKGMDESQITGAASTYARKYALNGLFCIDDTKDADATNDHSSDNGEELYNQIVEGFVNCESEQSLSEHWQNNLEKISYLKKNNPELYKKLCDEGKQAKEFVMKGV